MTLSSFLLILSVYCLLTPTTENVLVIGVRKVLASVGIYTESIPKIEFESKDWKNSTPASWKIKKSAEWIGNDTVKVSVDLDTIVSEDGNNKDIVILLDTSDDRSELKSKLEKLTNSVFLNPQNRMALITFNSNAEILSDFTTNKDDFIEKINTLTSDDGRNYTIGLRTLDTMLNGYIKEEDRDLNILFITSGYSINDTYGQLAEYNYLKAKYPYMIFNAIQYEMGSNISNQLKEISDNQFVANKSTLETIMYESALSPKKYDIFEIVETLDDYFEFAKELDVSVGDVRVEDDRVVWDLGDNFSTGSKATLNFLINLKDDYLNKEGYYSTNKTIEVRSKITEEKEVVEISDKKNILKNYYTVTYDFNPPTGCTLNKDIKINHFVYDTVNIIEDLKENYKPICPTSLFKGWEIVNNDVETINSDNFVMPLQDVIIRATWSKVVIAKSMEGAIHEKTNLYNVVKNDAESGSGYAYKYSGEGSEDYDNNVYYYKGNVKNNNVYFANHCWKIVRTTETGGVKIVYNGEPGVNGICDNTGASTNIATSSYGSDVGYMHNNIYPIRDRTNFILFTRFFNESTVNTNSSFYYSDYVEWDSSTGKYTLVNRDNSKVEQYLWSDNYEMLEGYYRCNSGTDTTCSNVYYISATTSDKIYFVSLNNGESYENRNTNLTLSKNMKKNDDGTYSLDENEIVTIKRSDWVDNYSKYKGYYMCPDLVSSSNCKSMLYLSNTYITGLDSENVIYDFKYANDVVYENGKYRLIDTDVSNIMQIWDYAGRREELIKTRYTCWSTEDECEEVYYISSFYTNNIANYVSLTGGKKIEDALYEMFWSDDVNKNDSNAKKILDKWFRENMTNELDITRKDYSVYLENTIFCNDRRLKSLGGFDPNGSGGLNGALYFVSVNDSYVCPVVRDQFTVNDGSGIGNGALTYPIGLLTNSELSFAATYYGTYLNNDTESFSMTPSHVFYSYRYLSVQYFGSRGTYPSTFGKGIRPVVSLRPGIEYTEGDGSADKPYVIDTSS